MSEMYAVIRIRGSVKMPDELKDTLSMLRLASVNHCVIYPKNVNIDGMLKKVVSWATWGEVRPEVLTELVAKRGRKPGNKKLDEKEVKDVSSRILKQGSTKGAGIKDVFRLTPPSKGHGTIKALYPRGAAGYRGDAINELLRRMI